MNHKKRFKTRFNTRKVQTVGNELDPYVAHTYADYTYLRIGKVIQYSYETGTGYTTITHKIGSSSIFRAEVVDEKLCQLSKIPVDSPETSP